jgi:hypothetical protein
MEKIKREIARLENAVAEGGSWGVFTITKNKNGKAPIEGFVRSTINVLRPTRGERIIGTTVQCGRDTTWCGMAVTMAVKMRAATPPSSSL